LYIICLVGNASPELLHNIGLSVNVLALLKFRSCTHTVVKWPRKTEWLVAFY